MKFSTYVIFFLLFGVLPDLYIVMGTGLMPVWKGVLMFPTLAALISLVFIGLGKYYTDALRVFSYLIFIFELPKFIYMLLSPLGTVGIVMGVAVALFFAILIFYSSRHLKVDTETLYFRNLPSAFNGLKVCQLSDLHLGSFGRKAKYVQKVIDKALERHPDIILFTGDLVNFASDEAIPYREQLARLKAPMGIFAIRGNHDYLLHGCFNEEERQKDTDRLLAFEQELGWHVLLDQHVILTKENQEIALAGVGNISTSPYFQKMGGNLKKAIEGIPDGTFTILMSHDPSHWRAQVVPETDIPLTLSGHTHGLKYKLAGPHPSHWKLHENGGIYTSGEQILYVSKGLGSAFAFRLGGFPRIDILTLTNTKT
ncbi:MAG: metallophosphoesterase [Bacteroidales bacterium]|nr:metallophosphoesterase [Bacteroidales bacterium]